VAAALLSQVDRALTELTQAMSSSANVQQNKQGAWQGGPRMAADVPPMGPSMMGQRGRHGPTVGQHMV
jgi:hypothetical protein